MSFSMFTKKTVEEDHTPSNILICMKDPRWAVKKYEINLTLWKEQHRKQAKKTEGYNVMR